MRTDEKVRRIFADLGTRYGHSFHEDPGTALAKVTAETEDPFKVLISTILSQRTRDERTEEASARLYAKYDTPHAIARAPVRKLAELIRPAGFYRQKAQKIREVSRILLERYGGRVPDTYEELVALPQVGPKTANCVLVYGFGKPAIPVDVHVAVVSRRLGLAAEDADEEEVERRLRRIVPKAWWLQLNELFVRFGKDVCRTNGPRCTVCTFTDFCRYYRRLRRTGKSGPLKTGARIPADTR
ncbi:MAG: endonuclease III [Euryarchaeota archaeon]|nr:endonuclease III [Euryarchaeota archaeon]